MDRTETKRDEIIQKIADYLLVHGMKEASLRKMAVAAGTSDRMLLHYFSDKNELLTAALVLVVERLVGLLQALRPGQMPIHLLLPHLAAAMKDPHVRPYLRLSLELATLSSGGDETYSPIARELCTDFFQWIASALQVDREEDGLPLAALAFALTEGCMVLDALGSDHIIAEAMKGIERWNKGTPTG